MSGLFHWEETEELCVYLVGYLSEILWVLLEIEAVTIDDNQFSLVALNPFLVSVVETLQIIDADALLEVSASALDMAYEGRDAAADIEHQVWELH